LFLFVGLACMILCRAKKIWMEMRALPVCVGLLLEYQMTEVRLSSHRFFLKLKYAISVDPCEDDILLQWQMEQDRNCQGRRLKRKD